MASNISSLIARPISVWTVLLDKDHCGQYNKIDLDAVSSIVTRSVSLGEELACQLCHPYVFKPNSQPFSRDGIGAPEYVHELELLQSLPSPRDYIAALFQRPVVQKDQWEVEMWCKVLEQVGGPAGLIYCTTGISPGDLEKLPLTSGYAYTGESHLNRMVQRAIQRILAVWQQRLGVIRDGAHAIPRLIGASRTI